MMISFHAAFFLTPWWETVNYWLFLQLNNSSFCGITFPNLVFTDGTTLYRYEVRMWGAGHMFHLLSQAFAKKIAKIARVREVWT